MIVAEAQLQALSRDLHTAARTLEAEIASRIEAIASLAAGALLGDLPEVLALEGICRLADRAGVYIGGAV